MMRKTPQKVDKRELNKMSHCFVKLEPCTPKAQTALSAELRQVINERNVLTSRSKKKLLTALNDIDTDNTRNAKGRRKQKVVQEILDSECVYLKQLEVIMTYFMGPIKRQKIISGTDYEGLFGSIETLYRVNGELLNALREDLTNVAGAFVKLAPFFKMYSVYAYDYSKTLKVLEDLHASNAAFTKLVHNQETRPEVQAKLSSLLIVPIQRVPRYCLLLKQVLDCTDVTDDDYLTLKDCVRKLEDVGRHINGLIADRENSQRILELSRCIKDGKSLIIKPGRKLIKEGLINRQVGNGKVKTYLILFNDIIMTCSVKNHKIMQPKSLKCSLIFPLTKTTITMNKKTRMFELSCRDKNAVLFDDTGSGTDEWITKIEATVEEGNRNRKTLRKDSSQRRPANKTNLTDYRDVGVSPGVSRTRKRKYYGEETDDDYESPAKKPNGNDDMPSEQFADIQLSTPKLLSKRKGIHCLSSGISSSDTSFSDHYKPEMDSLHPLRQREANGNGAVDVFHFGRANNAQSSFSIGGLFTGIKKVFGFGK